MRLHADSFGLAFLQLIQLHESVGLSLQTRGVCSHYSFKCVLSTAFSPLPLGLQLWPWASVLQTLAGWGRAWGLGQQVALGTSANLLFPLN